MSSSPVPLPEQTKEGKPVNTRSSILVLLLFAIATLPASFGLLQNGFFSSSDGMIHLYRLFELDRSLGAGILYPRWFPLSGYGYGLPVLNYYPPLAYYFAELFHLFGAGLILSTKLLIASTFIIAAFSMFLFARDILGTASAVVASIALVYLPYLLSDAYVRGNFPEFLAMAIIPFALFSFRRLSIYRSKTYLALSSVSFAAIILSHHLTAMLAAPLVAAYVLFLAAINRNWRVLLTGAGAMLAALALSAFYWVPAITELNLVFVDPASIPRFLVSRLVGFADFFFPSLAYSYLPQSDALLHSAGFPQTLIALLGSMIVVGWAAINRLAFRRRSAATLKIVKEPSWRGTNGTDIRSILGHSVFFLVVLVSSIFMMLNISAPLWYAIPTLRFMQFPWRFQVIAGVSIAFLIGVSATVLQRITNLQLRTVSYSILSVALVFLASADLPVRAFPLSDTQLNLQQSDDADYVVAQMGWSWTREFVPAAVQAETVFGTGVRQSSPAAAGSTPSVAISREDLLARSLHVAAPFPSPLSLHTFFFPGWNAYVDQSPARVYPSGPLGLVTVDVPAGEHNLTFRFEETPFRIAMDLLSAITVVAGVLWFGRSHRRFVVAIASVAVLVAALLFVHASSATAAPQPNPVDANFENRALLIGYSTERAADFEYVTLYWLALAEMDRDYTSFVHLVGAKGETIAQNDSITDQGVTPTTRWQVGEIVSDRHVLEWKNVPAGSYHLTAGLYLSSSGGYTNLIASDRAGGKIGSQVELESLDIVK